MHFTKAATFAGEVGLACFQEGRAELQLSQVIDTSHAYRIVATEILSVVPNSIVLLDSQHADVTGGNQAVQEASQLLPACSIRKVARSAFDDTKGLELVRQFCLDDASAVDSICSSSYLAVGCAGVVSRLPRAKHL